MKQTNLDSLNAHLFQAIEGLQNNSDPNASANEKMDVETAKAIADIGKVIVDGYKVKVQAMSILKRCDNPESVMAVIESSGVIQVDQQSNPLIK